MAALDQASAFLKWNIAQAVACLPLRSLQPSLTRVGWSSWSPGVIKSSFCLEPSIASHTPHTCLCELALLVIVPALQNWDRRLLLELKFPVTHPSEQGLEPMPKDSSRPSRWCRLLRQRRAVMLTCLINYLSNENLWGSIFKSQWALERHSHRLPVKCKLSGELPRCQVTELSREC